MASSSSAGERAPAAGTSAAATGPVPGSPVVEQVDAQATPARARRPWPRRPAAARRWARPRRAARRGCRAGAAGGWPSSRPRCPTAWRRRRRGGPRAGDTSATTRPVAQHDDAVGEVEDLLELVGDEQHGGARPPAARRTSPRTCGGLACGPARRSARRGSGGAGSRAERPGHGDRLALPARQGGHRPAAGRGRGCRAASSSRRASACMSARTSRTAPPLAAEEQVGDGVEVVAEGQVLPDDRDAGGGRVVLAADRRLAAADERPSPRVGR